MKPLLLKMKAFGPYAEEIEIDFSALPERGVFLITGDTGAGKTTIFDGIAYALYGSVSGSERKISAIRSTYAPDNIMTEVELNFLYKGNEYYIRRSPKQMKLKANPRDDNDYREIPAKAYLSYEMGGEQFHFDKVGDVNDKIDEIMGLTEDQFRRIVMIAQGEFQKILISDTNTRTQIFRSIFNTALYECIQSEIREDASRKKQEYEQKTKSLDLTKNNLLNLPYLIYDDKMADGIMEGLKDTSSLTVDDCFQLIESNIESNTKQNVTLKSNRDDTQKKLLDINNKIELHGEQNQKKAELDKAIVALSENKIREENAQKEILCLENSEDVRKNMERELFSIKSDIPLYEALYGLEVKRLELNEKIIDLKEKSEDIKEELRNKKAELEEKEASLKNLSFGFDDRSKLEGKKRELEESISIYQSLDKYIEAYVDIKERQVRHTSDYDKCLGRFKLVQDEYDFIEEAFIKNQAGIMAKKLREGQACPVCGSKEHPLPAAFVDENIDEAKLKKCKVLLEEAIEERNSASEKCKQDMVYIKLHREKIKEVLDGNIKLKNLAISSKFMDSENEKEDDRDYSINFKKIIVNYNNEANSSLKEVKKEINELKEAMEKRENLQREIPSLMEEISFLSGKTAENELNIKVSETTLNELDNNIKEKREALNYDNLDKCKSAINELEIKIADYDSRLKNARRVAEDARRDTATNRGIILQLEKDLTDYEEIDIELIEKEKISCADTISKVEVEIEECARRIFELENLRDTLLRLRDECDILYDEYSRLAELSSVFNGNVSGKKKIMLETYVQMMYFDRILDRANRQLAIMTSGKYLLVRRKDNEERTSKTGLELDVIDIGNGVQRPVDNLSGGEKFEASLALALGLSDEIQEKTGGIRLETMFIDEGFGTLDENSLKNTLIILEDLSRSNKQVGVISHISALKEAIGNKIIVSKKKDGTSSLKMQISEY